jgi:hypothetical protein
MFAKSYLTQSESSADTKNTSLENPVVAISPALDSSQKQTPAIIQAPSISPTKPPQSTHADNVLIAPPQTNATVAERQLEESKPKTKKHPFDLDSAFAAIGETPMPLPPHKTTKKTIGIQLDNADNYPELRHIKGYQWEYVGTPENDPWENKVFNPENSWNNASITKINGELYEMTLTRDNGERKSFTVRPVLKGAAYEDALKLYEKNKEEYEKKQLLKAEILARWKAETAE